jgi:ketosteroid isomerase-like protein
MRSLVTAKAAADQPLWTRASCDRELTRSSSDASSAQWRSSSTSAIGRSRPSFSSTARRSRLQRKRSAGPAPVAAAIHAITSGNPQPYIALWDDSPDVPLFGAWGPIERGPDALRSTFEWVGNRFGPAGGLESEHTVVQISGSLAYTVGFERGLVQVDGKPPAPMTIRVTHQFRYVRGEWRLMHRHADFPPADQRPT